MYLVSIDPGTQKVGVAILNFPKRQHIKSTFFKINASDKDYLERSIELANKILNFVKETVSEEKLHIVLEDQFIRENPRSGIKVAHMAGVTLGLLLGSFPNATYEFVPPRKVSMLTGLNEKNYEHMGKSYHDAVKNFVEKVLRIKVEGVDQAFAILLGMAAQGPN